MSRRDPPRGVSGLVVAAALAVGGAFLLPAAQAEEETVQAVAACPPEGAGSPGRAEAIPSGAR
jgi:hypothetical protein